jgi:hypothetical protein
MAMQIPRAQAPSPDILEAMIKGEQDVIAQLIASDPIYNSYVRRHRADRIGRPMGVKEFYSARNELDSLYRSTTPSLERRDPDRYASQCRLIYTLEHKLVSQ